MVEFLIERKMIRLVDDVQPPGENRTKKVGKVRYALMKRKYMEPLFDLSLLPIKMHLPMVSAPLDWNVKDGVHLKVGSVPTFFDLVSGYRNCASEQFLYRYRILTSREYSHYYSKFPSWAPYKEFRAVINKLQKQPFKINRAMLSFYEHNRISLERLGLRHAIIPCRRHST